MTCNNCAYFCFIYALMYIQMIPARGPKQMLVKSRQVAATRNPGIQAIGSLAKQV